uniref:Uncharacterized protein n=1 Tax=Kalanchoe fedtschenkoi TaxID=63787 RepID=A0A7N0R8B5_KALFE
MPQHKAHHKTMIQASITDQHFMLNFILSNYVGPDIESESFRRSAAQRIAEGLPLYTANDLGSSFVSISQMESLYYYVMRNAHPSLIVSQNLLHMYIRGNLLLPRSGLPEDCEQFTSHFPSSIHEQTSYPGSLNIVKGIVLIDDPAISFMPREDLEKFKALSGASTLKLDVDDFLRYHHEYVKKCDNKEELSESGHRALVVSEETRKSPWSDSGEMQALPCLQGQQDVKSEAFMEPLDWDKPCILPLLTTPSVESGESKASIILTGTAKKGRAGPPIGVVDIGVSKVAYFFQVALPGVRRGQLSCDVESNGKVHIRGMSTTGEETIMRQSCVYQMDYHHLTPPGPFTLSFSLPGPVDPRLFSPKFRDDGILEAVIVKLGALTDHMVHLNS